MVDDGGKQKETRGGASYGIKENSVMARQNYKQKHKVEDGTEGYREVREHHQEKKIKGARPRVSHGQKSQLGNALDS